METKFKKGDKVTCFIYGDGVVDVIRDVTTNFPVSIQFDKGSSQHYTLDGRYNRSAMQTLFLKSEAPRLVYNHEVLSRVVEVEDGLGNWIRRVAVAFLPSGIVCYNTATEIHLTEGIKSFTLHTKWREAKVMHELTIQELEEKLGYEKGSLIVKQ